MINHRRSFATARARVALTTLVVAAVLAGSATAQEVGHVYDPASFEAEARAFTGSSYLAVNVDELETAIEAHLPATDSVFLASGSLSPFAKALLALQAVDGTLEHTRHHVSVRVLLAEQPPAAYPVPFVFLQVDRYNLGPAIRDELVAELGEDRVAPAAEFGEGPHVSWRFVMRRVMGQEAALFTAVRAELSEEQAGAADCLGMACLLPYGGTEEIAVWHEVEEVHLGAELDGLAYPGTVDGLARPAAMLDLVAARAHFDPYESEVTGSHLLVAEFVLEAGLAQDQVIELALRQGHLLDDSLAAEWQRLVALPGMGEAPQFYAARAYECRRGDGGFAAPGEYCP
ncbi:MAG: hypothetical protein ROY82_00790 [Truepera sp.]|nr:hypothetical protein [Truepera sp.]